MFQHSMKRDCRHKLTAVASALLAMVTLGTLAASADDAQLDASACVENDCGTRCETALATARRATARYLREEVAFRDGFQADPFCVAAPGVGTMGFHYARPDRLMDLDVDPRFPEVLLYAERPNGRRYLVAVEYLAPVLSNGQPWFGGPDDPPPSIDNPPPVLFGHTFDGPMPGHNPSMPWHYDLHVWAWQHNPAGTFTQFNPSLSCP